MILIDTNIFIEIFKGNEQIEQFVRRLLPKELALSSVTAMELYYGALNKLELQRIRKHLGAFRICHISIGISETATKLIERYAKSHGRPGERSCRIATPFLGAGQVIKSLHPLQLTSRSHFHIGRTQISQSARITVSSASPESSSNRSIFNSPAAATSPAISRWRVPASARE